MMKINGKKQVEIFFLPYGVISKVFRGKYLDELKSLWNDSKLKFHGTAEKYQNSYRFKELLDKCYEKNWVTYCKETFNGAQSVINYLGKYTHRIAISNQRIKSMKDTTVTYAVKDYKNEGCWKEKTISGEEFIRRFLMHVPPKQFVRIRHYGLLSCRNKRKKDNSLQKICLDARKYISTLKKSKCNRNDKGFVSHRCMQMFFLRREYGITPQR